MLLWRGLIGSCVGTAFVICLKLFSHTPQAAVGQGLFGAATVLGPGLGLLVGPLLPVQHWRVACFLWGLLFLPLIYLVAGLDLPTPAVAPALPAVKSRLAHTIRQPSLWLLGACHAGTFGLNTILTGWLAVYFVDMYHLPLPLERRSENR